MSDQELQTYPTTALEVSHQVTSLEIIDKVIEKDLGMDYLEKMMDLQERNERNEARKAYHAAFAAFKADPPEITKDAKVKHKTNAGGMKEYNHASIGNVVSSIISGLGKHGLSHSWKPEQGDNGITITCVLTHCLGHSEQISMTAPADPSGGKNPIQAIASTVSYLQRYTILSITGMATSEMDDDGQSYSRPRPEISVDKLISGIEWFVVNNKTAEDLEKWLNEKADDIDRLTTKDQARVKTTEKRAIDELLAKEEPQEPETFPCPKGGIDVTETDCESCPEKSTCKVHIDQEKK